MSVCAQMTSPQNEGLFQRAIVQSGTFVNPYQEPLGIRPMTLAEREKQGERFFEELGVSTLEEARSLDARTVEDLSLKWTWGCWGEAIDGVFSTYSSSDWYRHTNRITCPVLLGQTGTEFLAVPEAKTAEELTQLAQNLLGEEKEQLLRHFPEPITPESIAENGKMHMIAMAMRALAKMNQEQQVEQPVYGYQFDAEIPGWDHPGTFHSVDLWFFFETLAKCWRPFTGKHYDLARQMCDYWANFIRTGDPNGLDSQGKPLPLWPELKADNPALMVFGDTAMPQSWPMTELEGCLLEKLTE